MVKHLKDFPNRLVSRVAIVAGHEREKSSDSVLKEAFGDKIDSVSLVLFYKDFRVHYITNEEVFEQVEEELIFFNNSGWYFRGEESGSLVTINFKAGIDSEEKENIGLIFFDLGGSLSYLRNVFIGARNGVLSVEKTISKESEGSVGSEVKEALNAAKKLISPLSQGKSGFYKPSFFNPSEFVIPESPSRTFYRDYYSYVDSLKNEENFLSESDFAGNYRLVEDLDEWGLSEEDVLDKMSDISSLAFEKFLEKEGGLEVSLFAQIEGSSGEVATFSVGERITNESYLEGVEVWLVVFPVVLLDERSYSSGPIPEYLALVMLPLFAFKNLPLKVVNIKSNGGSLSVFGKSHLKAKIDLSFDAKIHGSENKKPFNFYLSFLRNDREEPKYFFVPKDVDATDVAEATELEKKRMAHKVLVETESLVKLNTNLVRGDEEWTKLLLLSQALREYVMGDICLRMGEGRIRISQGSLEDFIFPKEGYHPILRSRIGPVLRSLIESGTWARVRDMFLREGMISISFYLNISTKMYGDKILVTSSWTIGNVGIVLYEDRDYMVLIH